jgi:hypothetical protein
VKDIHREASLDGRCRLGYLRDRFDERERDLFCQTMQLLAQNAISVEINLGDHEKYGFV